MTTQPVYNVCNAAAEDWSGILKLLEKINLDCENTALEQFAVCCRGAVLLGAGRLKQHSDAIELCSLGVREPHRNQGIGKALVQFLLQQAKGEIYVVTDIPAYFSKLGFTRAQHYPSSLEGKRQRCISHYECINPVVMSINTV